MNAETVEVTGAHCTPGGRVRLRLADGDTVRVPAGTELAKARKGDRVLVADVAPYRMIPLP